MRRLFQLSEGTGPLLRKQVTGFLRAQVLPYMVPEGLQAVGCLLMALRAQGLLMNSMSRISASILRELDGGS